MFSFIKTVIYRIVFWPLSGREEKRKKEKGKKLIWKKGIDKAVREWNAAALQKRFSFYNSIETLTYSSSNIVKFLKALPFNPFMSLSFRRLRYLPYKTDN